MSDARSGALEAVHPQSPRASVDVESLAATVRRYAAARSWPSAGLVGAVAFVVTVIGSWVPSYWNDEAATMRLARLSPRGILQFVEHKDAVHAVYALFMHEWIRLFGESELSTRLPSALAVGFGCAAVFLLARSLDYARAAWPAAVVMLLLPRVMSNGVEARSYAIATALIAWSAVWAVSAGRFGRWWRWSFFSLLMALSIVVFLYAALVVPALAFPLLLRRGSRRRGLAAFAIAAGCAGLVASPIAVLAAGQGGQIAWLDAQPVNVYTVGVESFYLSSWWGALFAVALLVLWFARRRREAQSVAARMAAAWLAIPALALLAASALFSPTFTPRYLSMCAPALALLVGMAITSWRQRTSAVLLAVTLLLALPTAVSVRTEDAKPGGQNFRQVANIIRNNARANDGFLLANTGTVTLRPRLALAAYPDAFDGLDDLALLTSYQTTGTYSDALVDSVVVERRELEKSRIWIVTRKDEAQPGGDSESLHQNGYEREAAWHVTGMTVALWVSNS